MRSTETNKDVLVRRNGTIRGTMERLCAAERLVSAVDAHKVVAVEAVVAVVDAHSVGTLWQAVCIRTGMIGICYSKFHLVKLQMCRSFVHAQNVQCMHLVEVLQDGT